MITEDLLKYAELDGTEWGETLQILCNLASYRDYISEELAAALDKEMSDQLQYAKSHCRIVEVPHTYTRTSQELEWDE